MNGLECFFAQGDNILFDEPAWLSFNDLYENYLCKDCDDYIFNNNYTKTQEF